jgi:hypothetical protein
MRILKIIVFIISALSISTANGQWVALDYLDLRSLQNVDSVLITTTEERKELMLVYNEFGTLTKTLHYDTVSGYLHSINTFFYDNNSRLERIIFESSAKRTDFNTGKVYRTNLRPFRTTIFRYEGDTLSSVFYVGDVVGLSNDTIKSYYKYYQDSIVVSYKDDIFSKTVKHICANGSPETVNWFNKGGDLMSTIKFSYNKSVLELAEINILRDEDGTMYGKDIVTLIRFWYGRRGRCIRYKDKKNHYLTYYPE